MCWIRSFPSLSGQSTANLIPHQGFANIVPRKRKNSLIYKACFHDLMITLYSISLNSDLKNDYSNHVYHLWCHAGSQECKIMITMNSRQWPGLAVVVQKKRNTLLTEVVCMSCVCRQWTIQWAVSHTVWYSTVIDTPVLIKNLTVCGKYKDKRRDTDGWWQGLQREMNYAWKYIYWNSSTQQLLKDIEYNIFARICSDICVRVGWGWSIVRKYLFCCCRWCNSRSLY